MAPSRHDVPAVVLTTCTNGLAVARCLHQHGVPVLAMTSIPHDGHAHSRCLQQVWSHDEGHRIGVLLDKIKHLPHRPVLFATSDQDVLALASQAHVLEPHCHLTLPPSRVVLRGISKCGFASDAAAACLPIPRTMCIPIDEPVPSCFSDLALPCVVKPEFSSFPDGHIVGMTVRFVKTRSELALAVHTFRQLGCSLVVQEWVPGEDQNIIFCLQYYAHDATLLASFTGRKLRQWPPIVGSTASCEPYASPEAVRLSTAYFRSLGMTGLCSMEFKIHESTKELLLIEPTIGRTDRQSDLATANGCPLPYIAYCDMLRLSMPDTALHAVPVRWVDVCSEAQAAYAAITQRPGRFFRWLRSLRPPLRLSVWSITDPLPSLYSACKLCYHTCQHAAARLRQSISYIKRAAARLCRTLRAHSAILSRNGIRCMTAICRRLRLSKSSRRGILSSPAVQAAPTSSVVAVSPDSHASPSCRPPAGSEDPWSVVIIEAVGHCNAHCSYCPQGAGLLPEQNMAPIEIALLDKALALAMQGRSRTLYLHHRGEPFLHPELDIVVRRVRRAGFEASFSTNLAAATPTMMERVLRAGVTEITVHLSGGATVLPEKTLFDRLRVLWLANEQINNGCCSISISYGLMNERQDAVLRRLLPQVRQIGPLPLYLYTPHDWCAMHSCHGQRRDWHMCPWLTNRCCAVLSCGDVVVCCLDQWRHSSIVNVRQISTLSDAYLAHRDICSGCTQEFSQMEWLAECLRSR